jgi:hypothetical protein
MLRQMLHIDSLRAVCYNRIYQKSLKSEMTKFFCTLVWFRRSPRVVQAGNIFMDYEEVGYGI